MSDSASKKGRSAIEVSCLDITFANNVDVTEVNCNSTFMLQKGFCHGDNVVGPSCVCFTVTLLAPVYPFEHCVLDRIAV